MKKLLLALGLVLAPGIPFPMYAQPLTDGLIGQAPPSAQLIGRLTRYTVQPADREIFQTALSAYVLHALEEDGNIQAEAYHERDDRTVLWLIERWGNRGEFARFADSPQARAVEALQTKALSAEPEVYHVTDLEPLTRAQWRRSPRAEDQPLVVMLFVDAQPGTQGEFKARYHVAMPQFRGEPGVVTYGLSQFADDETKFVTFEKFRSDAAFDYHLNFPAVNPILDYLNTSIKRQPFQDGLRILIEFAPLTREAARVPAAGHEQGVPRTLRRMAARHGFEP